MNLLDLTVGRRLKLTGWVISRYLSKGKLLDAACNDKALSKFLPSYVEYEGIDYPRADFEKDKLPYKSGSFDYVACLENLEHLKDQKNIIKEIKRVVKDNGFIFISLPNSNHIYYRLKFLFGKPTDERPFTTINKHLHFPIRQQSIDFIRKNFKILRIVDIGLPPILDRAFPSLFSYATLFVLKKK